MIYSRPPVTRVNDKVMIPQDEHPDINFVGLLIGPRGNTLKTLEKDVRTKMSRIMRKQDFCICENKGADQLCSNVQ